MAPDQAGCGEPSRAGHGRSTQGVLRAGWCFSLGMGSPCCTPAPCHLDLCSLPQELEVTLFSPDIWLAGERTGLGWHPPERPSSSGTQAPSIFVWTESLPDPLGVQNTGDGSSREGTEDSSVFGTPEEVATGRKLQTGSPPGVP